MTVVQIERLRIGNTEQAILKYLHKNFTYENLSNTHSEIRKAIDLKGNGIKSILDTLNRLRAKRLIDRDETFNYWITYSGIIVVEKAFD